MTDEKPRVIIIPPKPELQQAAAVTKQLRVAAYCRVSTKEEEQASSYEAQCEYYTDKIMSNKEWTMAGIFADEGITGTSTKERTEFLRMIRQCKQKKIDLILTKSLSRFARNTKDCLEAVRELNRKEKVTVILITHYMEEVIHADRVYVMDSGNVVMQGNPKEIFSQVDTLKKYGLDVPQVTLLAYELKKSGVDVPDGILTTEELVNALCQ